MIESQIALLSLAASPLALLGLVLIATELVSPLSACRLVEAASEFLERMNPTSDIVRAFITPGDRGTTGVFQAYSVTVFTLLIAGASLPGLEGQGFMATVFSAFILAAVVLFGMHFAVRQLLRVARLYSISGMGLVMLAGAGVLSLVQWLWLAEAHPSPRTMVASPSEIGQTMLISLALVGVYVGITVLGIRLGELWQTREEKGDRAGEGKNPLDSSLP